MTLPGAKRNPMPANDDGPPFVLTGPEDIFAPLMAPEYVVEGVLQRGSLSLLSAYGSSGKTWLAVELMLSVATGGRWLGRFPAKRGTATLLDWESGSYELRRRIQRNAIASKLATPVQGIDFASMPSSYLNGADFEERVTRLARERSLVVLDSLRAACPGVDENDSSMREPLDVLHRVGERTGCAFLVIVHAKKVTGTATNVDPRETLRGSSAIFDAADSVFTVTVRKELPLRIDQVKARQGRAVDPFEVTIEDRGEGTAVLAHDLGTVSDEAESTSATKALADAKQRIITLLAKDHDIRSKSELARRLPGVWRNNVLAGAKELEERSIIVTHDGALRLRSEVEP